MRIPILVFAALVTSLVLAMPAMVDAQSPAVRLGTQRFETNKDTPYTTDPNLSIGLQSTSSGGITYCVYDYDFNSGLDGWTTHDLSGRGDFAALDDIAGIIDMDATPPPNLQAVWTFYSGSTHDYSCGGWPGQTVVTFGDAFDRYVENEVHSEPIDWLTDCSLVAIPAAATEAYLEFDVYADLPIDNLVFYYWKVRWLDALAMPIVSAWTDADGWYPDFDSTTPAINATVFWSDSRTWERHKAAIGTWVPVGAEFVEVAIGVRDLCDIWCGVIGSGACHSHAPLVDNVRITRVDPPALWTVNDAHLFQDNFSTDGTTTGTVRVDMAEDIAPAASGVDPGDSTVVMVVEPLTGIGVDMTHGGAAVYIHVKELAGGKSGAAISGDVARWPFVSSSGGWTRLRMDHVYLDTALTIPVPDRYCADLDDDLYTPGDTVCFYFSAVDGMGNPSYWSQFIGVTTSETEAQANCMEMTCLPANTANGGDILYVDAYDGGGAQPYFDQAFFHMGILYQVDRYDMRGTGQVVNNALGTRVVNVGNQLRGPYRKIIWNSGDLTTGAIPDGTGWFKTDDFALLLDFVDNLPLDGGVYLTGDNLASEWAASSSASASALSAAYIGFSIVNPDHGTAGEPVSPLVVATPGSPFDYPLGPDTLIAYGGGDFVSRFDVLAAAGASTVDMAYSDNPAHGAVVGQNSTNTAGNLVQVFVSGFSFHFIRDDRPQGYVMDRWEHLRDVLLFLYNSPPEPVSVGPGPRASSLAQNSPNPFNPSTSIEFRVREAGPASLRVYDAAGRLVRTLVSGVVPAGTLQSVTWDGINDRGGEVASGVYFYRLVAGDYEATKKMVLVK